jgi:hypothetical protein
MERRLYNTVDKHGFSMYSGLSGRNILKARSGYKSWHPHKVQAIEAGMAQFSRLQKVVRFYDRSYLTGNLGNIQSIERVLNYDKRRYGTQMVMIDHLQRITGRSNLFELMSGAVNALEDYARKHQVTTILLSQLNESTKSIGSDATIVGSKGDGGALGAAVDYLFKLSHEYDAEAHISNITLNLFLSREGVGGKDVREIVKTEPVSGLILDESTPQRQNLF